MDKNNSDHDIEKLFQQFAYSDSQPDFDKLWKKSIESKGNKEVSMSEKKGGVKIAVWLVSFMVIVAVGWFGLTKFSLMKKQEKIEKGEAIVVTLVVGSAQVQMQGSTDWRDLLVEDTLQMGDTVRTGADSYCELQMVKRGIFRVESSSELYLAKLVNEDDKVNSRMKLNKGGIALKPNELQPGENFEVETATAVAAVRGTKFSVSVNEAGDTSVAVNEGKVTLQPVMASIDEAQQKGQVDAAASEAIKNQIAKPVEITPGQEVKMDSAVVQALNTAVGNAIEKTAQTEGPITADKLAQTTAAPEKTTGKTAPAPVTLQDSILAQVTKEVVSTSTSEVKAGAATNASLLDALVQKQEISEDAKNKLDALSAAKIIDKAVDLMHVKFDSKPQKSEVFVDGVSVGFTPMDTVLPKGKKISVRIVKDGFTEFAKEFDVNSSFTVNGELAEIPVAVDTNSLTNAVAAETNTNAEVAAVEVKKLPGDLDWEKSISFQAKAVDGDPLYIKGKIYAVTGNKVVILSTEGKVIKTVVVGGEDVQLTRPAYSDGQIYVGSESGGIFAISLAGDLLWKKEAGIEKFGASPAAGSGVVAVPSSDNGVFVYTKAGELITKINISEGQIFSTPIIINAGKEVVFALEKGEFTSYDLVKKEVKWTQSVPSGTMSDRPMYPLLGDNNMVVSLLRTGKVLGIDPADGTVKWNIAVNEVQKTTVNPQYVNGKFIMFSSESPAVMIVLNAATGAVISRTTIPEAISAPFVLGDTVYIGTKAGKVFAYNLTTRKFDWTFKSTKGITAVAGDKDGVFAVSAGSMVKIVK